MLVRSRLVCLVEDSKEDLGQEEGSQTTAHPVVQAGTVRAAGKDVDRAADGTTVNKRYAAVHRAVEREQALEKFSGALAEAIPGRSHRRGRAPGQRTVLKSTRRQEWDR